MQGYKDILMLQYKQLTDILTAFEPLLTKRQIAGGHQVISLAERLTLTLHFLATGKTFFCSLLFQFEISQLAISYIFKVLREKHLNVPAPAEKFFRDSVEL